MTRTLLALALIGISTAAPAASWTYRGTLSDAGAPANGHYDLRLTLLDEAGRTTVAGPLTLHGVLVRDGQFSAEVDFGLDLGKAPPLALGTEVQRDGSGFVALGAPTRFDAKAALAGVCWDTEGNAGTNPVTNFIGTTDAQPLVLRTRNVQSLRIEPSTLLIGGLPITANMISGSSVNSADPGVRGATIAGGGLPLGDSDPDYFAEAPNRVRDSFGTIGGGWANLAGDTNPVVGTGVAATVGGGVLNEARGGSSVVAGGEGNLASGYYSTVAGGANQQALGFQSTIGGGGQNVAQGDYGTIGGGSILVASGNYSTISGGLENVAIGFSATVGGGRTNGARQYMSTVAGGEGNTAGGQWSTVGGGNLNAASGQQSTVAGGDGNCAGGDASWSGGRRAKSRVGNEANDGTCAASSGDSNGDEGTFAWADAQPADLVSTGPNQFLVRAAGGIYLGTTSTVSIPAGRFLNTSTGGFLTSGGTWTNASSRALKTAFEAIDAGAVLDRVLQLPLTRWRYLASPAEGTHLGPVAEDFHEAFGLGADGNAISTVDASGVALAAIQGMDRKLLDARDALAAENARLRAELGAVQGRLARIEAALAEADRALSPRSRR